jgi:hypothetical protein
MQAHEVSATYARLELHKERGQCNECLHCRRTGTERLPCHYATVISSLLQVTTRSGYPTVIKTLDNACHAMSWDLGSDIHEPTT